MDSGFYKTENGLLQYAPNAVLAPAFTLIKEERENYQFPIDGWSWFDSEESAKIYFKIPAGE